MYYLWAPITPCQGAIFRGKDMPGMPHNTPPGAVQVAEPIDLLFELWTRVGQKKHRFSHICQVAAMEGTLAPSGEYD